MSKVGILAYGSLIEDPGSEIQPLIVSRICNVKTPFNIEFARQSSTRGNAPTVIPVQNGGSTVNATVLILKDSVTTENVADLVWRRETGHIGTDKHYKEPVNPTANQVVIKTIIDFSGIDYVIYTKIGVNIDDITPIKLAELAINSAKSKTVEKGKDGISYLISLKRQNISTQLMPEYEKQILKILNVNNLEDALNVARKTV